MLLKIGSKGEDVKKLQEKLNLSADGNFGLTKRVNGGTIGLQDRIKHFNEYYNLLK